ncbi:MAG: T9SS type A sorting domain-containing protein [candidate division WOR-3 bacterium]
MPRIIEDFSLLLVDFGPTEILSPPDTVNYGDSIFPKVIIRNYQMTPVTNLSVWLRIGNTYTNERFFPKLASQPYDTIEFNLWLGSPGWQEIKTWTRLRNDLNPNNDTLLDSVYVRPPALPPDVGVTEIILMNDTVSIGDTFIPKAIVKNFSPTPAVNFFVHFKIGNVFSDSVFILNFGPYQIDTIQFQPWVAQLGIYQLTAYTNLYLDPNPNNDTAYGSLLVRTITGGWQERSSMPIGSGKRVKQGGALVYTRHDTIYALKGNNTLEFYAYNTTTDSWVKKESLPMLGTKPKRVKKGAALTYDRWNNKIYALKGNNTREFWQYDLLKDSWIYLGEVPSANGKGIKGGSALACAKIGQNIYIYFMKGTKTSEFYAYDATPDTWIKSLKPIPILPSGKPMKDGSCMVKGDSVLFCLKGGYNDFYAYSIGSDTWYLKKSLPIMGASQRKKKVKDGAGLCYDDAHNVVYCLKGGNTQEFWAYYPDLDTWMELETIPKGSSNKRVKSGGALTFADGLIFALKGNNTRELWCYTPNSIKLQNPIRLSAVCANQTAIPRGITIQSKSNTINIKFGLNIPLIDYSLYDVLGRVVKSEKIKIKNNILSINMKGMPSGIYILKLNYNRTTITQKIILNH